MTEIAAFMAQLDDAVGPNTVTPDDNSDATIAAQAERLRPVYAMWAERAGLDWDEFIVEVDERARGIAEIVAPRITSTPAIRTDVVGAGLIRDELRNVAGAAALQFFCAGVLWEQRRHLPEIGDLTA